MERFFILDKFNTWSDWRFYLTSKSTTDPEPKTNYISLDGMSGTLDLSEALSGEITYGDRTVSATFWTDEGSFRDRESRLRKIVAALHGKKIKIIEPDDPDHYFYGRIKVKSKNNKLAYADLTIEAVCEPWRYALEETVRRVDIDTAAVTEIVINTNIVSFCYQYNFICTIWQKPASFQMLASLMMRVRRLLPFSFVVRVGSGWL